MGRKIRPRLAQGSRQVSSGAGHGYLRRWRLTLAAVLLLGFITQCFKPISLVHTRKPAIKKVKQCAIKNLHTDLSFLDNTSPITADEFLQRRDRLAQALVESGVDAFILEPGYTFQYYANISQQDWEPWEPEERPFLMVVMPQKSHDGSVQARTAFLAPHFEEGRARMLGIPARGPLDIVVWEEHWNPYTTLRRSHLFTTTTRPKVMVDEELRDFISRGIESAGFETVALNAKVELVRQIKSPAEVAILRAVNTGTVAAVRAMRPCLQSGLTENEVRDVLDSVLGSVGFEKFFNIVLFEEHAALPHGGFVTGNKILEQSHMILIDVGAHYLGYSSDICRSFFIDPPQKPLWPRLLSLMAQSRWFTARQHSSCGNSSELAEKLKVWDIVFAAQTTAAATFKTNNTAASVDLAARQVIEGAGYGQAFTHRVGHGIGIKAHESPYLNQWNTEALLQPGMIFTNEPGIYLIGKFGVRHEDIYLVKEEGEAELLTGRRATSPYEP